MSGVNFSIINRVFNIGYMSITIIHDNDDKRRL
jgi:hypothetical protein